MADDTAVDIAAPASPTPAPATTPAPGDLPEAGRGEGVYRATKSFTAPVGDREYVVGAAYVLKNADAKGLLEAGLLVKIEG